jgi:uncharacterized Fe-S center protein
MAGTPAVVHFARNAITKIDRERTLPAKFKRLLSGLALEERVMGRAVGIKMHLGGDIGYTTIHPLFVRILVQALKDAGARSIKVMDGSPASGVARGYTREVLGCEIVSTFGATGKYLYREEIGFDSLDEAQFGGEAVDCDVFIDLSHVKGHGDCGFGGALKNIAMGVVPGETRAKIHRLEGGITYDHDKCVYCGKCVEECPNGAISAKDTDKSIGIFYHHCTYCQHCVMVCPAQALVMQGRRFEDFSQGMALVTAAFLKKFKPEDLLFINVLMDITVYCDCWGMSTPSLVPDIGILVSSDIAAIETASLDLIKTEDLLPGSLPPDRQLMEGTHLFERIHGKDPYLMINCLRELYGGASAYELQDIP